MKNKFGFFCGSVEHGHIAEGECGHKTLSEAIKLAEAYSEDYGDGDIYIFEIKKVASVSKSLIWKNV